MLSKININMRCIEIDAYIYSDNYNPLININMRCIEIKRLTKKCKCSTMININMRCIEMVQIVIKILQLLRLTLT